MQAQAASVLPTEIPEDLSADGRWTLLHVGVALAAGVTVREIAKQHGVRLREIKKRLDALRAELTTATQ